MKLELGQRIYDAGRLKSFATIVARMVDGKLEVLGGFEENDKVLMQASIFFDRDKEYERIAVTDTGLAYYTWEEDDEVTEIND